jgi:tRNA-dihydrouridine synthase
VKVISVHGRTYKQSHSGEVNRDFIYRLKQQLPDHIIIGNGGIRSYQQAQEQLQNLDGIMIAQSAIGNPWIFTPHTPTLRERYELITQHLDLACAAEIYFKRVIQDYDTHDKLCMPTLKELENIAQ